MYLVCSGTHQTIDCHRCCHDLNECHHTEKVHQRMSTDNFLWKQTIRQFRPMLLLFRSVWGWYLQNSPMLMLADEKAHVFFLLDSLFFRFLSVIFRTVRHRENMLQAFSFFVMRKVPRLI